MLAGCAAEPARNAPEPEPCLVTSATDLSCAQGEPDSGGQGASGAHLHDYWGGQPRLTLTPVEASGGGLLCSDTTTVMLLRPADGEAIIQGTGTVEATLTFPEPGPLALGATVELWVKTAADVEAQPVGPATSGETVTLATTDQQNDLPHQQLSAWEFHVVVRSSEANCFQYGGQARLALELVRGTQAIPLYPGHPDVWGSAVEKPLVRHEGAVTFFLGGGVNMCLSAHCPWWPVKPHDGAVVPYDAEYVVVQVEHVDQLPLRMRLAYHGADTRQMTELEPEADTGATRTYRIPVTGNGDGPYATQSQWEFFLIPDNGANAYHGEYVLTATVQRAPRAA